MGRGETGTTVFALTAAASQLQVRQGRMPRGVTLDDGNLVARQPVKKGLLALFLKITAPHGVDYPRAPQTARPSSSSFVIEGLSSITDLAASDGKFLEDRCGKARRP